MRDLPFSKEITFSNIFQIPIRSLEFNIVMFPGNNSVLQTCYCDLTYVACDGHLTKGLIDSKQSPNGFHNSQVN